MHLRHQYTETLAQWKERKACPIQSKTERGGGQENDGIRKSEEENRKTSAVLRVRVRKPLLLGCAL